MNTGGISDSRPFRKNPVLPQLTQDMHGSTLKLYRHSIELSSLEASKGFPGSNTSTNIRVVWKLTSPSGLLLTEWSGRS